MTPKEFCKFFGCNVEHSRILPKRWLSQRLEVKSSFRTFLTFFFILFSATFLKMMVRN